MIYEYKGQQFPEYLKTGNACQHIATTALLYCKGVGVDAGCGAWPLPGAIPIDAKRGGDVTAIPHTGLDYLFSSHCLEHLPNPIEAIEHWRECLKPGGVLFLYLPHPEMTYWRPQWCRKHLHSWAPGDMAQIVHDLGFVDVIHSERDLAWSFAVVGYKPKPLGLL